MDITAEEEEMIVVVNQMIDRIKLFTLLFVKVVLFFRRRRLANLRTCKYRYSLKSKIPTQIRYLRGLVGVSDVACRNNLRMNMDTFSRLCFLLENVGGLLPSRNCSVQEQTAIFLNVLSHHKKNVVLQTDFHRSGFTISKHFNRVLKAILKLHSILLVTPEPVGEDCDNERWKYFKGCLGALDGTYILVRVPQVDRPRYRNRKGDVSVNVLAVCDQNMNFVYLLTGWEGSAADGRILRDAVTRTNGFKVPLGHYYLVDNGYTNGEGFLAPYRQVRYHLKDFGYGTNVAQDFKEYFNLKHAKARNHIERAFGILKSRWGVLRSPSYYPIKLQNRIIMACCLLHNFIRTNSDFDPEEDLIPADFGGEETPPSNEGFIGTVEPSDQWTNMRDELAMSMYNEWMAGR